MVESFSKVTEGLYYVREDDQASQVAERVYGDVKKSNNLLRANPSAWSAAELIRVPGVQGRVANVRSGESSTSVIRRMFPGQPTHIYLDRFYSWNGGDSRVFAGGELVFVPER